jgi:hypothetical protein
MTVLACGLEGHKADTQETVGNDSAERLFGTLFFRHLRRREECPSTTPAARRAESASGDIVPTIVSVLHGSFTAPKLKETLYIVSVGECSAPDELGSYRVVVTRDHDDRIAFVAPYAGTAAVRAINVDGDGVDEWVAISSSCVGGVCTETAAILRAAGLKLTTVKDLGSVYYSTCCAGADPGQVFCSNVILQGGRYVKITDSHICSCL